MTLHRLVFPALAAAFALALPSQAGVSVRNVTAVQRYPWNGLVDIECTVTGIEGATNGLKLAVAAVDQTTGRSRNGSHFQVERDGAWSDDREIATNGTYRLLWDARADLGPVVFESVVVRVSFDAHEKVQLWEGGPYWATTNVGAEEPEENGLYFWWGDTVGYRREGNAWVASDGSSQNFSFGSGNTPTYNKSVSTLQSEGWIASKEGTYVLAPEHDAAHVQWGGAWRMPTYQELYDLCYNKCDWTWTTRNGVNGYVVRGSGDFADASIFLPAAGRGDGTSLYHAGSLGRYWSSVPDGSDSNLARDLYFYSGDHLTGSDYRCGGRSVRPVQGFAE